jgi:hypothetical protein
LRTQFDDLIFFCFSTYVALAPKEFHPGWTYVVQMTVTGASGPVTVSGKIKDSNKPDIATGSLTLNNG